MSDAQPSQEPTSLARIALDVERALESFAMRLGLSVAIIVSLLPMDWAVQLDPLFLLVFGSEFLVRLFVVLTAPPKGALDTGLTGDRVAAGMAESKSTRLGAWTLLAIDFIALLSFLPLTRHPQAARWLRLFRLTRMLLLVGYWAPIVRDLWSIMARRERARQIALMAVFVGGLSFAGAVVLHHLGDGSIDTNGDDVVDAHDRQFVNLLWWAFRQVQDPGNLLQSPHALPVLVTSMMLTLFGIFLVSFLIGLGTDVVRELLELSRLRPAGLRGHTVVVGVSAATERLLSELMRYYRTLSPAEARPLSFGWWRDVWRQGLRRSRYLVVGHDEEPPDMLRTPELSRIVYRQHAEQDHVLIARAELLSARRVLLLADPDSDEPDVQTIQTLLTLVERLDAVPEDDRWMLPWGDRHRVLIAEILEESHVAAARAALRGGRARLRAFVVPTERVLALFVAGVVQRPGLGDLLEQLLTHHGHEIYTCFFQSEGLGFRLDPAPVMPRDPVVAVERLVRRGLDRGGAASMMIPIGLIRLPHGATDPAEFHLAFNPSRDGEPPPDAETIGFVAVADKFATIREFAESLVERPLDASEDLEPPWLGDPVACTWERFPQTPLDRVLVCGFRHNTIYLLEQLMEAQAGAEILVLLRTAEEREEAIAALEAHTALVRRGLLPLRHAAGFEAEGDGAFRIEARPGSAASRVRFEVADWVASRDLVDLPAGFGHVAGVDAVVFVAGEGSDARTTTALLKLEALLVAAGADLTRPRVVAEVSDGRLAARLQDHCRKAGKHHVRVYSVQQLRAFFLFQSVVVPGFDAVYSELLGNWGQSLVRLRPARPSAGTCTFAHLAMTMWQAAMLLIAVELYDDAGVPRIHIAPARDEPGASIDLSRVRSIWVVAPDRA